MPEWHGRGGHRPQEEPRTEVFQRRRSAHPRQPDQATGIAVGQQVDGAVGA